MADNELPQTSESNTGNAASITDSPWVPLNYITKLGELRDGALVAASCVYVVGYATWAVYASRHGLGAARALDMQYFVIGGPVAAIILGAIALFRAVRQLMATTIQMYRKLPSRFRRAFRIGTVAMILLNVLIGKFHPPEWFAGPIAVFVLLSSFLLILCESDVPTGRVPTFARVIVASVGTFLILLTIVAYVVVVYERIPQAFGGGKARKATLELRAAELSPLLLSRIAPGGATSAVVRSNVVSIVATFPDSIVIVTSDAAKDTVQLKDGAIAGITWLD